MPKHEEPELTALTAVIATMVAGIAALIVVVRLLPWFLRLHDVDSPPPDPHPMRTAAPVPPVTTTWAKAA